MGRPASARSSGHAPAAAAAFTVCEAGDEPPAAAAATPILFTHTLCPYAERVWLALLEKGVPFHLCHVDLSSKPAWFRRINVRPPRVHPNAACSLAAHDSAH